MSHVSDSLVAFLDGALDPSEREAVERHLAACAACVARRDALAGALSRIAALPPPPEPAPGFEQRFYARLARERAAPRGLLARLPWRWLAPAAAVGAAAAVAVGVQLRERAREEFLARHLDALDAYEVAAAAGDVAGEDAELVAHLHELEEKP